jgi:hypothetical protein
MLPEGGIEQVGTGDPGKAILERGHRWRPGNSLGRRRRGRVIPPWGCPGWHGICE